jgi:hypothetical protein
MGFRSFTPEDNIRHSYNNQIKDFNMGGAGQARDAYKIVYRNRKEGTSSKT